MSGCAVCGSPSAEAGVPCARCGFPTPHGEFFSQQHYQTWLRDSVIPYRQKWQKESVIYRMEERIAALEKQVQEMQEQLRQMTGVREEKPEPQTESIPQETFPLQTKKKRVYTYYDVGVAVGFGQSELMIPSDVTEIGEEAFWASDLREIKIPDGVTRIGEKAFGYCTHLRWITLPKSVAEIEERAFAYCTSLESVVLTGNLRRIGSEAFDGCVHLERIDLLTDGEVEIAEDAFKNVTATVYYSRGSIDAPWVGKNYGGKLIWIAQ